MDRSWFHWSGGLFFRRTDTGDVQIGAGASFDTVTVLHTIDPSSWASIVATVSADGENHLTYQAALGFHQGATVLA